MRDDIPTVPWWGIVILALVTLASLVAVGFVA